MSIEQRVRWLTISQFASWGVVVFLLVAGFGQGRGVVESIEARKISVVGDNGKAVLVIAGRGHLPGPSMNGKQYPASLSDGRELLSGMIFFNEQGDEVGGLVYNGIDKKPGYSAVGHFSLDQWKQNQVVAIQYVDSGTSQRAGLNVWDRPAEVGLDVQFDRGLKMQQATGAAREALQKEADAARARGELGVERIFVGSQDRAAQIRLRDTAGRVRARLVVGADDVARLEFLDAAGAVTASYPAK